LETVYETDREPANAPTIPDVITLNPDTQIQLGNYILQPSLTDDNVYFIFDTDGVPLGYVIIPDGMTIYDIDIKNDMIPLGNVTIKENPITGDERTHPHVYGITVVCMMIILLRGILKRIQKA